MDIFTHSPDSKLSEISMEFYNHLPLVEERLSVKQFELIHKRATLLKYVAKLHIDVIMAGHKAIFEKLDELMPDDYVVYVVKCRAVGAEDSDLNELCFSGYIYLEVHAEVS